MLLTIYQFITLSGLEKALLPLFSFIFEEVSIFTCQFGRIFRSQIKLFCQTHDRIAVTSLVYGNDDLKLEVTSAANFFTLFFFFFFSFLFHFCPRNWVLDTGFWIPRCGFRIQGTGLGIPVVSRI